MAVERKDYDFAPAGPTYSRATRAGDLLFVSGCTARGSAAQGGTLAEQLAVTLERVIGVVRAEGGPAGGYCQDYVFRDQHFGLAGGGGGAGGVVCAVF